MDERYKNLNDWDVALVTNTLLKTLSAALFFSLELENWSWSQWPAERLGEFEQSALTL